MTDALPASGPELPVMPPVLLLVALIVAVVVDFLPLPLQFMAAPVGLNAQVVAGIILIAASLTLGLSAVRLFRQRGTSPNPHAATTHLVADGPFRFTRNPMYLGFVLLLLGLSLVFSLEGGLILTPLLWLALDRLIVVREEAYLAHRFGDDYQQLLHRTRRWL